MRKTDQDLPSTPTVQVIERMFALMDVLSQREEAGVAEAADENGGWASLLAQALHLVRGPALHDGVGRHRVARLAGDVRCAEFGGPRLQ